MLEISIKIYDNRQLAKNDDPLKDQNKIPCEACKSKDTNLIFLSDHSKKEVIGEMIGWDRSDYKAEYKCNSCGKYMLHVIGGWTKDD